MNSGYRGLIKTHHKLGASSWDVLLQFEFDQVLLSYEGEGGMEPGDTATTHPLLHEVGQVLPRHCQDQLHKL